MNLKENVMKLLLEDGFNKAFLTAATESGAGTNFDVAENYAQGAINENPNETNASVLAGKAISLIVASFGL